MKTAYYVTSAAGKTVAGLPSPGEGKSITLTPAQAEQPLRLGYLTTQKPDPLDHDGDGRKGGARKGVDKI